MWIHIHITSVYIYIYIYIHTHTTFFYIHTIFFIHSSVDAHLGCFMSEPFLAERAESQSENKNTRGFGTSAW